MLNQRPISLASVGGFDGRMVSKSSDDPTLDKTTKSDKTKHKKAIDAVLIVYGRDDKNKAHASSFGEENRKAAIKASHLMGFKALAVTKPAIKNIAEDLPQGRLFDSGKGFVPFAKDGVCLALEAHAKQFPRDVRELSTKQIAEVEKASAPSSKNKPNDSEPDKPAQSKTSDEINDIKVGTIVLAVDDPDDGWWEAKVTHAHKSGTGSNAITMLTLEWNCEPVEPSFVRRSDAVAYLPTNYEQYEPTDDEGNGAE